ncbi:uncharacterized protein LOC122757906 [Drosophila mojavensis]|uniref:uncharacterized protein LOC122757906 n=1 Tax=Drosophila mojavensis TaxID=7230 RepID=UPI001CD16B48|nr:uncharacterized protein LOC122757906 [Drosophila mojavensis]
MHPSKSGSSKQGEELNKKETESTKARVETPFDVPPLPEDIDSLSSTDSETETAIMQESRKYQVRMRRSKTGNSKQGEPLNKKEKKSATARVETPFDVPPLSEDIDSLSSGSIQFISDSD